MRYREVRRRIRLLRNSGYKRHKHLNAAGFYKEWFDDIHHVRIVCPWSVIFSEYNELIRFLHLAEMEAEDLMIQEKELFYSRGL